MSIQGSIADARTLLSLLGECERLIGGQTGGTSGGLYMATRNAEKAFMTYSQLFMLVRRLNTIMRHMGLGEDMQGALNKVASLTMATMMLYRSMQLLQMATPYGAVMGMMGIITGIVELGIMVDMDRVTRR